MQLDNLTLGTLAEMMGPDATTHDADRMLSLMRTDGAIDTDDVSESTWLQYIRDAVAAHIAEDNEITADAFPRDEFNGATLAQFRSVANA